MYEALAKTPAHGVTVWAFEGPPDPVDYVHKGGVWLFANRLILPDDPKLAETAGASSGGVSLWVRGRKFRKAMFDRSNLARVDFSAADLEGASLQGAKLEGAKFECATPAFGFNWDDGAGGGYDSTPDRDCTSLNGVNLSNARLDGASLRGAELLGASFTNVHGSAANFSRAQLMGADFQTAQLRAADFTGTGLQGARFSNSTLQAADFSNAYMQGVDLSSASLQGASFEKTLLQSATINFANIQGAYFKGAALPDASLECVKFFRSDFENSDRAQAVVTAPTTKRCEGRGDDFSYIMASIPNNIRDKYNLPTDVLPRERGYYTDGWGFYPDYPDFISELEHPEKLDANTFAVALNKATSDLPEGAKTRVRNAFERLNPATRTKEEDDAEKAFWAAWAEKSASQENHAKALALRLEEIACVGEGAPYVARGLLRAGRFDRLYQDKETSEKERNRILERLRKASGGGGDDCPGARGLVEADFPKPAS